VSESDQTLRQLLEVEKEAASIVEKARADADAMIAEADRKERLSYNDRYKEVVAALEKEREAALTQLDADYDDELTRYRKELDTQSLNTDAFNQIARTFFLDPA
jgi:F0F1-type ATP synthase membrane subunit b/b'